MISWKILLAIIICACSLAHNNKDTFVLYSNETYVVAFKLQHSLRITFIQYYGHSSSTIFVDEQLLATTNTSFQQMVLPKQYLGSMVRVEVRGGPAFGFILRQVIEKFQLLSVGEEKLVHLKKNEVRIIEVHPRRITRLIIQRMEGNLAFTNNRCKSFEKMDCLNQLQRLQPIKMEKYIEVINLDYCSNCIFLIKLQTLSKEGKVRFSIDAQISVIGAYSTVSLLKKEQKATFYVYGQANSRGKILHYSGGSTLQSDAKIMKISNGYFYELPSNHNFSTPFEITLIGLDQFNYIVIEVQENETNVMLRDGFPTSIQVKSGVNYTILFKNKGERENFVINGNSSLMQRLSIHFLNKDTNQHYTVRPRYIFGVGVASQNFQLDNLTAIIEVQIKVIEGDGGYLNLSASLDGELNLPLDWKYSSILGLKQIDHFIVQGISGLAQIVITKCVDCHLEVAISMQAEQVKMQTIENRIFKKKVNAKQGQLLIKVTTNNYAYYSIIVTKETQKTESKPYLKDLDVKAFLTQPEAHLQLQFLPPTCGQHNCQDTKYYLIEGSDARHIASRAYCPNSLFDFDERTKDVVFDLIQPTKVNGGALSYIRPLKHRDWLVIIAQTHAEILSYNVINSGEIREYNKMRWPVFYLILFLTFAAFMSFVLFMALRRKKTEEYSGYIRGGSASSVESLS